MKLSILAIIFLTINLSVFCQVKTLKVVSSKEYENNTRTTYLVLSEKVSQEYVDIITTEISAHKEVKLFSYYDKTDYSKCMFTVDKSLTESMVVDLINQVIYKYDKKSNVKRDFSKTEFYSNYKIVYFKVNGLIETEDIKSFYQLIDNDELIFSIEIFDDGLFKLNTDLKLTPDYINTKLVEFKAKIEDEYLQ